MTFNTVSIVELEGLLDLIERAIKMILKMKVHIILPATTRKRILLLLPIEDINFGLVRIYATPFCISWIVFIVSDLVIRYTDTLLVFRWVQIVLLL